MKKIYPIMAISAVSIGVLAVLYLVLRLFMYGLSHDRSPGSGNYDPNNPGFEYAPEGDMYHSIPYDAQTEYYDDDNHFNTNKYNPFGMTMRMPVEGTVARGQADYIYTIPNTPEGYAQAGKELVNPVPNTPENMAEGKRLFNIYCWHCHGHLGEGDGPIMASGKFPKPSWVSYKSDYIKNLPEGNMFHTITYGKNLMGNHGRILNPTQRWQIIHYIKYLSTQPSATAPAGGTTAPADSTKKGATASAAGADTTKKAK
jgi:mono/diheme cytochrome c family protein